MKLPRPLGLQRQRCGNVQVQERNGNGTEQEREREATEDPEAPHTNILLDIYIYILEWTRAYTCTVFRGSERKVDPKRRVDLISCDH